jgi:hypothetical protein
MSNAGVSGGLILMVTRVGKFKLSAQTKPYIADSHQDLPTISTRVGY